MATEYVYVKGKANWVKPDKPNKFGKWAHQLYPDTESLEKINSLIERGLKNRLAKDEDGYYISFSRPQNMTVKGKIVGMAPPEILEADGKTPLKHLVGNGSDVTVKLECYPYNIPGSSIKGLAARWASMRVDNLIPYEMNRDFDEDQQKLVKGLPEQPAHSF